MRPDFRGSGIGTLLYAANWERMTSPFTYWDIFRQPSPFDHTWSLAIEEQFYLVWPLVTVAVFRWLGRGDARRGIRSLAVIAVLGAVVSFTELWVLFDPLAPNRAYFGTDTRIGATLVGAALAAVTLLRRPPQPAAGAGPEPPASGPGAIDRAMPTLTAVAGLAGAAWMVVCVLSISGLGASYYQGGLVSFALAAALVIHATNVGPDTVLARALSLRPLRYLGLISYGVYLWHWPVIVYMTPQRMPVDGLALDAVRVATTLGVATLSYRLVEMPIRRGALRPARAGGAAVAALALTLGAVLVVTVRPSDTVGANGTGYPGSFPMHYQPATIPAGGLRVLLVGDSGAHHLAPELVREAERQGGAVESVVGIGCTVINPQGVTRFSDGQIVRSPPGCNRAAPPDLGGRPRPLPARRGRVLPRQRRRYRRGARRRQMGGRLQRGLRPHDRRRAGSRGHHAGRSGGVGADRHHPLQRVLRHGRHGVRPDRLPQRHLPPGRRAAPRHRHRRAADLRRRSAPRRHRAHAGHRPLQPGHRPPDLALALAAAPPDRAPRRHRHHRAGPDDSGDDSSCPASAPAAPTSSTWSPAPPHLPASAPTLVLGQAHAWHRRLVLSRSVAW